MAAEEEAPKTTQTAALAEIYTDGSCHTQHRIGAWVAILLIGPEKFILSGVIPDTTHNRMELTAVIRALECCRTRYPSTRTIKICTDSQYVMGLAARAAKTSSPLRNADLVKELLDQLETFTIAIEWVKIKAHQKSTDVPNYNREADKLARKMLRENSRSLPLPPHGSLGA